MVKKKASAVLKGGVTLAMAIIMTLALGLLSACQPTVTEETCPIQSVTAIGMMDYDGAKLRAIALEYDQDLKGADITKDTFEIGVYDTIVCSEMGNGKIGDITAIYVNDKIEVSKTGGSGSGNYVIIEVFTDYTASATLNYANTMAAKATQVKDITLADGTVIPASSKSVSNSFGAKAKSVNFVMPEIEGFKYYTNDGGDYGADGPAYTVKNCFNQQDGKYYDIDLSYALYLPEDYNENGNYAMVTLQNPAAAIGTHPMASVLAYRSASVYASEWAQELVKEQHGVDGLIVVVPVVTARVNDNGGTPAEYEAIVSLWDHIIETYHVNTDYIYGSGQSVGGMIVLETNRNRDNFFAGILLYDNQWSQNYYVDTIFARDMVRYETTANTAPMHYPRTDGNITWNYRLDTDGNKVYEDHDPYNYYYLVSDDNIMIMNSAGGGLSNDTWSEMKYLYWDLVGYDLRQHLIDGTASLDDQNADLRAWVSRTDDRLNINWISFTGAETSRKLDASYEWLLSQSRQTAIAREKLDLNKPFAIAEEQIQTEERAISFTTLDGEPIYYLTGKAGAGTQCYNTFWGNTNTIADSTPGWLPEGMSWEVGVTLAHIEGVTAIGTSAVAIQYDHDMENLAVNLKGDKVYNYLTGEYREEDFIVLDPFEFYDAAGNQLTCTIRNIYVNEAPETVAGAARQSGSGCYVIIEFESPASAEVVYVIQRTTLRTNTVFASASYLLRGGE